MGAKYYPKAASRCRLVRRRRNGRMRGIKMKYMALSSNCFGLPKWRSFEIKELFVSSKWKLPICTAYGDFDKFWNFMRQHIIVTSLRPLMTAFKLHVYAYRELPCLKFSRMGPTNVILVVIGASIRVIPRRLIMLFAQERRKRRW